jgi:hypothetical protein
MIYAVALLGLLASASGKIYFKEDFNSKTWESRWTSSDLKPKVCFIDYFRLQPLKH